MLSDCLLFHGLIEGVQGFRMFLRVWGFRGFMKLGLGRLSLFSSSGAGFSLGSDDRRCSEGFRYSGVWGLGFRVWGLGFRFVKYGFGFDRASISGPEIPNPEPNP